MAESGKASPKKDKFNLKDLARKKLESKEDKKNPKGSG